jgi:hypothetical protein
MTDCATRFRELTSDIDTTLDEDLAALRRRSERERIEQYNTLKADEQAFLDAFTEECPDFLTQSERTRVRGRFRLARLLIAASFYSSEGRGVPPAMQGDFIDQELQAVVDFDRYRQFDALSEDQIEAKIRRMEGEVYDLVTEYTSTQLANIEELLEHPRVQQDVMERLLERYETRREKIRRGFFIYVEVHGLEHMVETIETAVEAVNDASETREEVWAELRETAEAIEVDPAVSLRERRRLEAELDRIAQAVESGSMDRETLETELKGLEAQATGLGGAEATADVDAQIERTTDLEARITAKIEDLQEVVAETAAEDATDAEAEAAELVESELEQLREQREQMRGEIERLEREREQLSAARDSLEERRADLEARVDQLETSFETEPAESTGIDGSNAITAQMARLFEMDYLGRFDISVHEAATIRTRDGEFEVPADYWEGRSRRWDHTSYLVDLLDDEPPDQYPTNAASQYEITESGYLGLTSRREMLIEAAVISNLHAHAKNGFDAQPADLDSFLAAVNEAVDEAEDGEYEYLLALASPTGWSDRVVETVAGDEQTKTRVSQYVSVCLVDLQDGTVLYDDSDPVVAENASLFELSIDAERVEDCVETIRGEYVEDIGTETVLARDVAGEHGYDETVVKRAFNRLEDQGVGDQLYLDELGLSLDVGR